MIMAKTKDIRDIKECPECASPNIIHNEAKQQVVCNDCDVIYEPLTPKEDAAYSKPLKIKVKKKSK